MGITQDPSTEAKRPPRHIFLYGSLDENPPPVDYRPRLLKLRKPLTEAVLSLETLPIEGTEGPFGNKLNSATWDAWQQLYGSLHAVYEVLKSEFSYQEDVICDHPTISRAANAAINGLGVSVRELMDWMVDKKVLKAQSIPALPTRYRAVITRAADRLKDEMESITTHFKEANAAGESLGQSSRRKGGKPPLEKTNPLKFQVYQRIQQAHAPGESYVATVTGLKGDQNFLEQVKEANEKLDSKLVRKALAFFDQRQRSQARKKQETDPA